MGRLRRAMKPGRYNDVLFEEAMELAYQLYDFKTCIYPDGSAYGISDAHKCRKGTEGEVQDALDKAYAARGIKPNGADVKRYAATIEKVKEQYGEAGLAQLSDMYSTLIPLTPGRKTTSMDEEEIRAMQNPENQKKLMDGYKDPTKLQGGKNAIIEGKEYDDKLMDMAIDGMPKGFVSKFKGIGKPAGYAYQGEDADGNPKNGSGGTDERARAVLKQWFKQDGKCAYTGLPMTLDYADLEHVKPLGVFKAKAEQPKNWVWTRRSVNQMKSESTMDEFMNKTSFGGQKGGVNGIKDMKAYNANVNAKTAAGAEKQKFRDMAKDPKTVENYMKNRNAVVEAFGSKHERYLTLALGQKSVKGDGGLTFWDEVTRKGERNQVKGLTTKKGEYKVRESTGKKQSFASWINKNYADMTPSEQRKMKQIWAEAKQEIVDGKNPYGNSGTAFGQRVAEMVNAEF